MICDFCSKVKNYYHKWFNHEIQEEYLICEECLKELKQGKYKE